MKIEITEKGVVQFDVTEFVESLSAETKADLCRSLVADELLFQAVADFITTGQFHDGWFIGDVTKLRERFLPLMPETARELVRDLVQQRDRALTSEKQVRDDYWKLWHAFPQSHWRDRPEPCPYTPTWKIDEGEADAMLAAAEVSP